MYEFLIPKYNPLSIFISNLSQLNFQPSSSNSIRKLGTDSKLRNSISIAARETTEKRFDKERMVKETLDILENMS